MNKLNVGDTVYIYSKANMWVPGQNATKVEITRKTSTQIVVSTGEKYSLKTGLKVGDKKKWFELSPR